MRLAVIAYPVVSDDDQRWIEDVRKAHDPQSALLAAHFTLVFPVHVPASAVVDHAKSVLAEFQEIKFVLRRARVVRDVVGNAGAHVFLVPDQGADEITRLHERLYGGLLEPCLRTDIPFVPHVTVAADRDFNRCEQLADRLNEQRRQISGVLTGVDVVEGDAEVRTVARLRLGTG
jgi:2'-5' RNA ligase